MLNLTNKPYLFVFLCLLYGLNEAQAQEGFVMNFQIVKNHSKLTTDAFAEFTGNFQYLSSIKFHHVVDRQHRGNSDNIHGLLVVQHSVFQLQLQHCVAILLCKEEGRPTDMHILW